MIIASEPHPASLMYWPWDWSTLHLGLFPRSFLPGLMIHFFLTVEPIPSAFSFQEQFTISSPLKVLFLIFQHLLICISLPNPRTFTCLCTHVSVCTWSFMRCEVGGGEWKHMFNPSFQVSLPAQHLKIFFIVIKST